jgi:hypothetical protein
MAYTSLQNLLEEQHEVGNAVSEDRDTYSLFQGLDRSCSCLTEFTQRYTSKQMLHPRASYGVLAASALRSLPRYRGLNPIEKLVKFRLSNFFRLPMPNHRVNRDFATTWAGSVHEQLFSDRNRSSSVCGQMF